MLNRIHTAVGEGFTDDATDSCTPDAKFYFDGDIYQAEIKSIFRRNWLYFCHQSQVPKLARVHGFRASAFGLDSVFGFRFSDLDFRESPNLH